MICIHLDTDKDNGLTIVFAASQKQPSTCVVHADFVHPDDEERLGQAEEHLSSSQIEALIDFLRGCL